MVCQDVKIPPLQKVTEVFDGQEDSKEFTIVCTISSFCGFERLREEGKRLPLSTHALLEHCSHSDTGGICDETSRCVEDRVAEERGVGECVLDGGKCSGDGVTPLQLL